MVLALAEALEHVYAIESVRLLSVRIENAALWHVLPAHMLGTLDPQTHKQLSLSRKHHKDSI